MRSLATSTTRGSFVVRSTFLNSPFSSLHPDILLLLGTSLVLVVVQTTHSFELTFISSHYALPGVW